ncbi:hypothetical protein GOP47_0012203 [Adiantum capillus-veneris]|uniref:Uncharacterized protein n=1 Tax=Adiantum capillus-veneris TaxID=13818 RepID=A0A9D4ZFG1_ADICA|nr:hypothetical protein GOP47_0012203 [Adiantum capillus-veneris]
MSLQLRILVSVAYFGGGGKVGVGTEHGGEAGLGTVARDIVARGIPEEAGDEEVVVREIGLEVCLLANVFI